jgi:hypothetical protein
MNFKIDSFVSIGLSISENLFINDFSNYKIRKSLKQHASRSSHEREGFFFLFSEGMCAYLT